MHQTPQGLLRMTDGNRPWAKDLHNVFSTLVLSLLPFSAQCTWWMNLEHTFSSADAIDNLASLSFSQSNRTLENGNLSRIVTTTMTVTFSMNEDAALEMCQMFLDAGLVESSGREQQQMAKHLWRLTPKGACILDRFCVRNGIGHKSPAEPIAVPLPEIVVLERCRQTDRLVTDHGTIEVIFVRFLRTNGVRLMDLGVPGSLWPQASRPSLRRATNPRSNAELFNRKFTGSSVIDWLTKHTTAVDQGEAIAISRLFIEYGLIEAVQDITPEIENVWSVPLQANKPMLYQVTERGKCIATGGALGDHSMRSGAWDTLWSDIAHYSHAQQLEKALSSSALRLLFREHLRRTYCEENLSFYSDVDELLSKCRQVINTYEDPGNMTSPQEIAARACGLYNIFLAPGSPCELNINNRLRNNIATHLMMITAPDCTLNTLHGLVAAIEEARASVFYLMTNDSLPKFFESLRDKQALE